MGKALTRDAILGIDDRIAIEVEVPEWGGTVRLRGMTAADRDAFDAAMLRLRDAGGEFVNMRAELVARSLVDDDGMRLFDSAEAISDLGRKSGKVLDRLYDVAVELNGLRSERQEAAGEEQEAMRDFASAPAAG